MKKTLVTVAIIFAAALAWAQGGSAIIVPSFEAELGAVKVLYHTYRVGPEAGSSTFDFVNQGGQEILYPITRFSGILDIAGRHEVRLLYQPLSLSTKSVFRSDVTLDGVIFPSGTPMDIQYDFPFYRATYQYRFLEGGGSWLAGGAAVQLRNASIRFTSADGSLGTVSQNLGVVPALALSGVLALGGDFSAGFDATGIYASSAFFNGANFTFEGSLLDASLRVTAPLAERAEVYLNARFLGGSAAGVSQYPRTEWTNSQSPETANYLATFSLSLGAKLR